MELEVSPRHGIATPSSVAVLSGLSGSGGNSLLGRLWGSVLVWGHYSLTVRSILGVSCANAGASSCSSVSLERTVYPQVVSLDLIDRTSRYFLSLYLVPGALVPVPVLALDSFLSLLSTLNLPLFD